MCSTVVGLLGVCSGAVTSAMLGAFRARKETRDEFLSLVAHRNHQSY